MTGRTIGAAGFVKAAMKPETAATSEPPPKALKRNARERGGVAEQKHSQDPVRRSGRRHLHFLYHFDN
jgi:hypothetical protein